MPGRHASGTDPRLQLVPVSLHSRIWLFALAVVMPLVLASVLPLLLGDLQHDPGAIARLPGGQWLPAHVLLPSWVGLVAIPVWLVVNWLMYRQRVEVDAGGLEVVTMAYRDRVPLQDLQLDAARVIDLDEHPDRRPFLKTGGTALPGFRSGRFRSRGFQRLFVATAGGKRLLWLPTTRKHALLLQLKHPQALLERLREVSGNPAR